jgi:transcriptional regulator with XRE-family HTH domain
MKQTWKERLTAAREEKGLSKTAFASAMGVSKPTATDWEKSVEDGGIAEMNGKNLTKAAEVLDINPEWLLYGSLPVRRAKQLKEVPLPAPIIKEDLGPTAQDIQELINDFMAIKSRTDLEAVKRSAKVAAKRANRASLDETAADKR